MIRLILLISIIFVGCKPSDNPIFKLPEGLTPEQTAQRLSIKIRQESRPNDTDTTFTLVDADLPNESMYFSISQNGFNSSSFQLNVNVKQITGIYDLPSQLNMTLVFWSFNSTQTLIL